MSGTSLHFLNPFINWKNQVNVRTFRPTARLGPVNLDAELPDIAVGSPTLKSRVIDTNFKSGIV